MKDAMKKEADHNTKKNNMERQKKQKRPSSNKEGIYKVRLDVPHSLNQIVVEYFDKNRNPLNLTEKIPLTKKEEVLQGIQQIMEINEEKATMGNKKDEQSDKLKRKQMRSLIEKNTRKKVEAISNDKFNIIEVPGDGSCGLHALYLALVFLKRLNPEVVSPREFILHTRTRIAFDDNYLKRKKNKVTSEKNIMTNTEKQNIKDWTQNTI